MLRFHIVPVKNSNRQYLKRRNKLVKLIFLLTVVLLPIGSFAQSGDWSQGRVGTQRVDPTREASKELALADDAYRREEFAEAQQHSQIALKLDPSNQRARASLARHIHAQYRPGLDTEENRAKGRAAVDAYKVVLQGDPDDDEAFRGVTALLGSVKEDADHQPDPTEHPGAGQDEWFLSRAYNGSVSATKRAFIFITRANNDLVFSSKFTELSEQVVRFGDKSTTVYRRPDDANELYRGKQYALHGLEMTDAAIGVGADPEVRWSSMVWAYKASLLREMAKYAEMENQPADKADFEKRASEADKRKDELLAAKRPAPDLQGAGEEVVERTICQLQLPSPFDVRKIEDLPPRIPSANDGLPEPEPPKPPTPLPRVSETTISVGVLNDRAISLPVPPYPPVARAAHASGTATVEILVDENGNVIEAHAVSGHPLLHAAAVAAAREARFPPATLSGDPVKVLGVVTYNFGDQ
jgi:TonB family protein